jgi:hypothetical protein
MKATTAKVSRNLWPTAIIAWFVIFAAALAAWITVAVRQKMDLVRPDYYEEEVGFQRQLDRVNRTVAVRGEVDIHYDAAKRHITLLLPAAHLAARPTGRIHLYRPSDAALDMEIPLAVEATGLQRIGAGELRGGLWRVRVQWNAAQHDYFFEQVIVVDEASPSFSAAASKVD